MRRHIYFLLTLALFDLAHCSAATIVSLGPDLNSGYFVAPGGVVTMRVTDLPRIANVQATSVPLPDQLGGLRVQFTNSSLNYRKSAGLFAISQPEDCLGDICPVTDIQMQIPVDLDVTATGRKLPPVATPTQVVVSLQDVMRAMVPVLVFPDTPRLLGTCERATARICEALSYHADGNPVSASAPARPGETVIIYAVGLGSADQGTDTGAASSQGARSAIAYIQTVEVVGGGGGSTRLPLPLGPPEIKASMVPGFVGLAQFNIFVPEGLTPGMDCAVGDANATVRLTSTATKASVAARICVIP